MMQSPRLLPWAALALGAALSACAPATRVVVLPQEGGSAVEVSSRQQTARLDKPYATAEVSRGGQIAAEQSSAEAETKRYSALLAALPPPPQAFVLNFVTGSTDLTPESQQALREVLTLARNRPGGEIMVTGHTDTVGKLEANDQLSLRRAQALRELIIAQGYEASRVESVGRGEREPLVPTADEVDEPRNRRAVVVVR